ncbi:MAG: methyl-accepting chemotaxis protein, partial [Bradyrhizobium sp.]
MAFGLFKKRLPEPVLPAKSETSADTPTMANAAEIPGDGDSSRAILELLELELSAMIRQLERAAHSVATGAEATATTLSTIRRRTD